MLIANLAQLKKWLKADESEHLEFKEANNRYDFEKLIKYCVALANEGGGCIILGVSDKKPRKVVGTKAFPYLGRTKAGLLDKLLVRVEVQEINHPAGRVLVFSVPSRPIGMPIQYKGAYWMRSGEALVPMTPEYLKMIFMESHPDYSAEFCPAVSIDDLDSNAIEFFRKRWIGHSGNRNLSSLSHKRILKDTELMVDDQLTNAALILFGKGKALDRHLPQAEVIFEYRSSTANIHYQQRKEFRKGFFLFYDDLWETINLRNEVFQYQVKLERHSVPTFNEQAIREAILNAVSHREYRMQGSVFVKQFPKKIEIVSPGGFPPGISEENILWEQAPRNRRIAETFARCGFVERSGQGADLMFEESVKDGKPLPDFGKTNRYSVHLILHGDVQDPAFLKFLRAVNEETSARLSLEELLVIDLVHREKRIPAILNSTLPDLRNKGVLERVGRKHILSRRFYTHLGKQGEYTRKKGLDKETNKELLLKHIKDNAEQGSAFHDLHQVLPNLSREEIKYLLKSLRQDLRIHVTGKGRGARWHPSSK